MTASSEPLERLGTVREAADRLGTDIAGVFELVARGELVAERAHEFDPWTIYRKEQP